MHLGQLDLIGLIQTMCQSFFLSFSTKINDMLLHYCNNIDMIHRINLGNKKEALNALSKFKNKDYSPTDIELFNVHMKKLNDVIGYTFL